LALGRNSRLFVAPDRNLATMRVVSSASLKMRRPSHRWRWLGVSRVIAIARRFATLDTPASL
jgi:hypothetical protein